MIQICDDRQDILIPLSVAQAPQFQLWTIKLCQPDNDSCEGSLKQSNNKVIHNTSLTSGGLNTYPSLSKYLLHCNMFPVVI